MPRSGPRSVPTAPTATQTRELARLQALERGVRAASKGARPLRESHPVLFRAKGDVFAFIASLVDNAHMESFFHSLKAELPRGVAFSDERELRMALRQYLRYYKTTRLHSSLGSRSPRAFER